MANTEVTVEQNVRILIAAMPTLVYFSRPSNQAFHNLCTREKVPAGVQSLLGLGLKFCLQKKTPQPKLSESMERFRHDVRLKYWLADNECNLDPDREYIPELYINSEFVPPTASREVEKALNNFEARLDFEFRKRSIRPGTNLSKVQQNALKFLRDNDKFVVLATDKNLGPAIIEKDEYIRKALKDHLSEPSTYRQLTDAEATTIQEANEKELRKIVTENTKWIYGPQNDFFVESLKDPENKLRTPIFYALPKIHKTPWKTRPVVSTISSVLSIASKWLDYQLQQLIPHIRSYIRDSTEVLQRIKKVGDLPPNSKLFTADAVSMYTNIDSDHAIKSIDSWLTELAYKRALPEKFPKTLVVDLLRLVMQNNVFEFGSSKWLQLTGTAMGTPVACAYATIAFGIHENRQILPKYQKYFKLFVRFIDDVFGVWTGPSDEWSNFKHDMDKCGLLRWEFLEPCDSVVFLDLSITINRDDMTINTRSYEKDLNLHLYIPPRSAHPPGILRSLIFGRLRQFYNLNSNIEDFQSAAKNFYTYVLKRGYNEESVKPIFIEAAEKLDARAKCKLLLKDAEDWNKSIPDNKSKEERVFFFREFHPRDISRKTIRDAYDDTCLPLFKSAETPDENFMEISQLTVAYNRPKNLRDLVSPSKLTETPGGEVETYIVS